MREYKSNLFTKRHYEWLVDMCVELSLDYQQVEQLSDLLTLTNPNYNANKFILTVGSRHTLGDGFNDALIVLAEHTDFSKLNKR